MKHRAMIGASTLALLLAVGICGATEFCGSGPDGNPDRPCDEDFKSAEAVAAKYESQWRSISGVASVSVLREASVHEVVVEVKPASLADSVTDVLPSEVEGYPVRVFALPSEPEPEGEGARIASNGYRYGRFSPCTDDGEADADSSASEVDT